MPKTNRPDDSARTQGPLSLRLDLDSGWFNILDHHGNTVLDVPHNISFGVHTQIANLRRLVACWNACEGISTEAIERGTLMDSIEQGV